MHNKDDNTEMRMTTIIIYTAAKINN